MPYTTINKSTDYFNTVTYTGNGSTNAQTGVGFQPDFTWIKSRSNAENHNLFDAVRGATERIRSNGTEAEDTRTTSLTAFDSDGFTLGSGSQVNTSGWTFASWNWKANGSGSSNTDGSITSTVSANTTSGFSIVSYTGTGSVATVGHGLSSTPKVLLVKRRDSAVDWSVFHADLPGGNTRRIRLNSNDYYNTDTAYWNDTSPTSSVFTIATDSSVNASSGTYICYAFAEVPGYSKFGSYTGNGNADGTFVYTGFKPAFVIFKATDSTTAESWLLLDTKRQPNNVNGKRLRADTAGAEDDVSANYVDLLSNGFKIRSTDSRLNGNGQTLIYMAFGQSLVGSNNVPATAR